MFGYLKQSTASQSRMVGPFVDDTDFKTLETGLTIANTDVKLSKNGAAGANKNSGGGTHRNNGMYSLTFDATDTNTVGELAGSINVSGALVVVFKFVVLEEAVYDDLFAASAGGYLKPTTAGRTLDVNATGEAGIDLDNTSGTLAKTTDITGFNDLSAAQVNTECDTALTDYDPPTRAELTSDKNEIVTDLDDIKGTGFVKDTHSLVDIEAYVDLIDDGTSGLAKIATDVGAVLVDTGTTLDGKINTIDTVVDGIQTDLDNGTDGLGALKTLIDALNDISAADVNAQCDTALSDISLDKLIPANGSVETSGSNSSTQVQTNLAEATNDHYNGMAILFTSGAEAGQTRLIADYVGASGVISWLRALTGTPADASTFVILSAHQVDLLTATQTSVDNIEGDTNELQTDWTNGGRLDLIIDELTAQGDTNESKIDTVDLNVDAVLVDTGTTLDGKINTIDTVVDAIKVTTDSITDLATLVDAVWDEDVDASHQTAGTAGKKLDDAGGAADPWATALPGAYGAGTAGKIVGDNINAPIATIDTIVDAIKAVTDLLPDAGALNDLAAILTDTGTTLDTKINDIQGATFSSATDSLEALRNRGDSAWITGAGGSDRLLMVDTTIATLASQTSFTLTAGSADDDAYNNCTIVIEDVSTATQKAVGLVSDYVGATKTITLKYDPAIFTMAVTDKIYILAENALKASVANRQLGVETDGDLTKVNLCANTTLVDTTTTNSDMRGTDSAALASVCTEGRLSELDAGTGGKMANQVDVIEADTTSLNDTKVPDTISLANINAECDTALTDYDPPTRTELTSDKNEIITDLDDVKGTSFIKDTHSLKQILDDVTGLNGDAMRGTDGANTVVPDVAGTAPTAVENRQEMDSNSTQLSAIVTDTGTTLDIKINTIDTVVDAIKAVTDLLPNAGALSDLATILADTNELQTDDVPGLIAALNNISSANVLTQVNAALDTAIAELSQAKPTATPTLRTGLMLLYMALRNKMDVTTSTKEIHNDAGTQIAKKTLSDDGTTYTEAEMEAGT